MIGNSGAPLEHLAPVTACDVLGCGAKSASRLGTYFFSQMGNWAEGGEVRERALWFPTHPLAGPPRRLAAQGGKGEGELCTALTLGKGI
jgi:hypothetical protein